MIRFGPAGLDDNFTALGHKNSLEAPAYLSGMGLNAFEYQCGHGVRVSAATARSLGEKAREHDVALSVHAPYFISLSSPEEEKRTASVRYILQAAEAGAAMGGDRVVVHSGSKGKMSREEALELAKGTLRLAAAALDEAGLSRIRICPETMGKTNQIGTLEEVLELCGVDERFLPCVDFGHLNARTAGGCATREQMAAVLDGIENRLGSQRARSFHVHFSKIEYTEKGGEKRHLTFEDTAYGPEFEPLAELLARRGLEPVLICESRGTQSLDAVAMREIYLKALAGIR